MKYPNIREEELKNKLAQDYFWFYDCTKMMESPLYFSPEAKALLDSGRALWRYYHQQPGININASLYDIRAYFQGRNEGGKMNSKSGDEAYKGLIGVLPESLQRLAEKIEPKVYLYGFLKL